MSKSLNDIIKRSGFGEKMGIKLKQKKKLPLSEGYIKAAVGKTSGIKIENYSLKSTINEIINYKRGLGEDGPMSLGTLGDKLGSAFKTIWDKIVEIFETIWKFLTSQLGAFWDWITGKGKESTKKAIEAKFYEISGGEVGEKLALPAPGQSAPGVPETVGKKSTSDMTKYTGGNRPSGGPTPSNSPRVEYNGKNINNTTANKGNNNVGKITLPKIFVDEEYHNTFKKILMSMVQSFEMEGNNVSESVEKLKTVNSSKLIEELKSDIALGENMKKVKSVMATLVLGKDAEILNGDPNATERNKFYLDLKKNVQKAEHFAYEDETIDPGQVKPSYSKWKLLEKLIDNVCSRMESYKSSVERAVSSVTKLAKDFAKAISDQRTSEGVTDEQRNNGKRGSESFINIATRCGNELKIGLTELGKDMKKLIEVLKPRG